jgi:hypothetical protein
MFNIEMRVCVVQGAYWFTDAWECWYRGGHGTEIVEEEEKIGLFVIDSIPPPRL